MPQTQSRSDNPPPFFHRFVSGHIFHVPISLYKIIPPSSPFIPSPLLDDTSFHRETPLQKKAERKKKPKQKKREKTHPSALVLRSRDKVRSVPTQLKIHDLTRVSLFVGMNLLARLGVKESDFAGFVAGDNGFREGRPSGDSRFRADRVELDGRLNGFWETREDDSRKRQGRERRRFEIQTEVGRIEEEVQGKARIKENMIRKEPSARSSTHHSPPRMSSRPQSRRKKHRNRKEKKRQTLGQVLAVDLVDSDGTLESRSLLGDRQEARVVLTRGKASQRKKTLSVM